MSTTLPAPKLPAAATVITRRSPMTKHHTTMGQAKQAVLLREVRYRGGSPVYECRVAVYRLDAEAREYRRIFEAAAGDPFDREKLDAALA